MSASAADIVRGRFNAEEFTEVTSDKCPGEVLNNPKDAEQTSLQNKMPKYTPRMKEVGFDAWAWSIANSEKLLPSAVRKYIRDHPNQKPKMQENFNKIWDGQSYKYAIHPKSGKMCGVVDEEDIARIVAAERTQDNVKNNRLTDEERMDKIESDLIALVKKMGGPVNQTVQKMQANRQMQKLREKTQDRQEARDIQAMRQGRYNIRPTSGHGCAPFQPFKTTEKRRFRESNPSKPEESTLQDFHVGEQELKHKTHYFGRLPVKYGTTNDMVGCVSGDDPSWLAKDGGGNDRFGNHKIYHGLGGLQRVRKMPQYDQSEKSGSTELHNIRTAITGADAKDEMSHGEAYQIAALCGQQLTQRECESQEPMVVTPLGNTKDNTLNPNLVCQFGEHDRKPSQMVCQPRFLTKMTDGRDGMRRWYFGDAGKEGFVDREQRTTEAYRRQYGDRDYTPNNDIAVTPEDSRRAQLANKLGTNRYGRQHKKMFETQTF